MEKVIAQRIKGTLGITGLMTPESSYRRRRLAPRCRLRSHPGAAGGPKGFDCSSMKVLYVKLGLERRETVTVPIYC